MILYYTEAQETARQHLAEVMAREATTEFIRVLIGSRHRRD